jgi:hypothetical protein
MRPVYLHENKASAAIANALSILQGCVKPAPGRQQTQPNVELESQEAQRETQAGALTQREEQLDANGMNNSEASFRVECMLILSYLPFSPTLHTCIV